MKIRVNPTKRFSGTCRVPGDKSISHRSLLFGALTSGGTMKVTGLGTGEDNRSTRRIMETLGASIRDVGPEAVDIDGVGLRGLSAPKDTLDCGNSGTSMRLLSGVLVAQGFDSVLVGDESLSSRPMMRICGPLRQMGASITGQLGDGKAGAKKQEVYPPLLIAGGQKLAGISYQSPVASAQVKSAILLAGLYAEGETQVTEPGPSRDHTERMLRHMGVPLTVDENRASLQGGCKDLAPKRIHVPGDPSSGAFCIVAALVTGGEVSVNGLSVNPTRTGFLEVLREMGAPLEFDNSDEPAAEPFADVKVSISKPGQLRGVTVTGDLVVRSIDEIPVLAVAAASGHGETRFEGVMELRVKESDRISSTVAMLRGFGVTVEEWDDGFSVLGNGGAPLKGACIDSHGDHRIAMSAVVAGLMATGETVVENVASIETSFPSFVQIMNELGCDLRLEE